MLNDLLLIFSSATVASLLQRWWFIRDTRRREDATVSVAHIGATVSTEMRLWERIDAQDAMIEQLRKETDDLRNEIIGYRVQAADVQSLLQECKDEKMRLQITMAGLEQVVETLKRQQEAPK